MGKLSTQIIFARSLDYDVSEYEIVAVEECVCGMVSDMVVLYVAPGVELLKTLSCV